MTTQLLTDEELNAIEARASAATPSPWTAMLGSGDHLCTGIMREAENPGEKNILIADLVPDYFVEYEKTGHCQIPGRHVPNLEFIMAARDDVPRLTAEIRLLRAVLDGDPEQIATPDQRRAWRRSAIRYADKVEAERDEVLELLDAIIAGYEAEGIGPLLLSIRAAQKWRQVKTAQDATGAPRST